MLHGPVADGYLAVAMLLGFFAEIHFFFYPGVYAGLVTTSDALRLAFFVVLITLAVAQTPPPAAPPTPQRVQPPARISDFHAQPASIQAGQSATLVCSTTGTRDLIELLLPRRM
jgi:hypothetical protein